MDSISSAQNIINPWAELCGSNNRQAHQGKFTLHSDNAPIDKTKGVPEHWEGCGSCRMDHHVYGPDLAPCGFFLFRYLKHDLAGKSFGTNRDVFSVAGPLLAALSGDSLISVSQQGVRRLETCWHIGREYVE
jgi:hypothetical protein